MDPRCHGISEVPRGFSLRFDARGRQTAVAGTAGDR